MNELASKSQPQGLDTLFQLTLAAASPQHLTRIRDAIRNLPTLGPYNAALAGIQRPGARFVASEASWREHYGRSVKPEAQPIVILAPFAPVNFVYEYNDTEGPDHDASLVDPFRAKGDITEAAVAAMAQVLARKGVRYTEVPQGTGSAGSMRLTNREILADGGKNTPEPAFTMVVNSHLNPAAKVATILHEMGHRFAGHHDVPGEKLRGTRSIPDHAGREFEAEIVAWLLCARLGIDNPSGEYLAHYLDGSGSAPSFSLDVAISATGRVERLFGGARKLATLCSTNQVQPELTESDAPAQDGTDQQDATDQQGAPGTHEQGAALAGAKPAYVEQDELDLEGIPKLSREHSAMLAFEV